MFELAAGQIQRPFNERSSVPTTLVSSLVHGGMLLGMFVLVSSGEIALPDPQEALHLTAILVAAPPPPPPPAAAPPAPAPPAPEPSEVPLPEVPSVLPKLDLLIPEPVQEETPELSLPAGPALTAGFGSGEGSGFGVEGGVGFGDSMSSAGPEPVRIGGAVTPELIHRAEPVYPPSAVAARVEGTVIVEATVDERGNVREVRVLRSIAPLDQAAIEAVMQWRYSPLHVNDQPVQFILTVHVSFRLH